MLKFPFRRNRQPDRFAPVEPVAIALREGRIDEADSLVQSLLKGEPRHADALHQLGVIRMHQGRPDAAAVHFAEAVQIKPTAPEIFVALGQAQSALGRFELAIRSYDRALLIAPQFAPALCGRGDALRATNRHEEAIEAYGNALAIEPEQVGVLVKRGNLLQVVGRTIEAMSDYDQALLFAPDAAVISFHRGVALHSIGRAEDAVNAFKQALAIEPGHAAALQNIAVVLGELHRNKEELIHYERLLAIEPDYPHVLGNVAYVRAQLAQWDARDELVRRVENAVVQGRHPAVPFVFITLSQDAAAQLSCAKAHTTARHPEGRLDFPSVTYHHDRIRVAYISADFHDHAMPYLMAGLFERHDRRRFEVTAISLGPDLPSRMRDRLKAGFERFIDVRANSDRAIATTIRDLEIDIAVDLMGYTGGARTNILALRPAPVQVNYLGYPGTMGASFIDYILADPFVIPAARKACYSEHVVCLPDTFQVNDATRVIGEWPPSRIEAGLPATGFVFCSFNNTYKITPAMFDVWMRLLRGVDGSVLWLLGGNETVVANLCREAQMRDVAPGRLIFGAKLPYAEHLARYRHADLFLDTLPFNAGTTASDALWAGLPVLTCAGDAFAARMAGSLLHAVGLPELVTHSLADYEALALKLATTQEPLHALRARLESNRIGAPLFDSDRFRHHIETAYQTMWDFNQRNEAPRSFSVAPRARS